MIELDVRGVGVVAPGLPEWPAAASVLGGERPYESAPVGKLAPQWLTAAERRRATAITKLAVTAAGQALDGAAETNIATVFASSEGDLATTDVLCRTMSADPPWASPTRFHNAVHNAAVGYWSIAAGVQANTTSVCAYDDSFAAGMLEAGTQLMADGAEECLLVAYDEPPPEPLYTHRPIAQPMAVAFRLARARSGHDSRLRLVFSPDPHEPATTMDDDALEALRTANPAGRALPLLALLAGGRDGQVVIPCPGGHVAIKRLEDSA